MGVEAGSNEQRVTSDQKRLKPVYSPRLGRPQFEFVQLWLIVVTAICLMGCSAGMDSIQRIALLAPFEGRQAEIGYNAYYAVQLALKDASRLDVELLAVDDGESRQNAIERARALAKDPLVKVVLSLGADATSAGVQDALGGIPLLMIGNWGQEPQSENAFSLNHSRLELMLADLNSAQAATTRYGSDAQALEQFRLLQDDLTLIRVLSNGRLPDEAFQQRYAAMGLYVPPPNLLATLTYDAARLALDAMQSSGDALSAIRMTNSAGISGRIQFATDGYWEEAPVCIYAFTDERELTPVECPIE